MTDKPMTDEEYVNNGGNVCPHCRGNDVEAFGTTEFDSDWATRNVECNDCNKTWQDVYKLAGWTPG